jgi:hypothetical protein
MLLWADPFAQYGGDESAMGDGPYASVGSGWTLSNAKPRTGSWSLHTTGSNGNDGINGLTCLRRLFGGQKVTSGWGYAFYCDALPAVELGFNGLLAKFMGVWLDRFGHTQVAVYLGTDGSVSIMLGYTFADNGGVGTVVARSDPCIRPRSYNHIEAKLTVDGTTGYVEIRVNQVTVLTYSGNTDTAGTGEASQFITTCGYDSFIGMGNQYLADLFAWDDSGPYNNDFIGDFKCYWLPPNADTAQADWTPSTGATSFGVVDESPPDDTDYLSIVATTGKTNLGLTNLPADVIAVAAVVPLMRAWKTDAGVCDVAPGILQGATYSTPVGQPANTAPQYYQEPQEVDPVSGVPFTLADVNSLDLVIERTA